MDDSSGQEIKHHTALIGIKDDSSGQEIKHHTGNIGTMDDASGQEIKHHTGQQSPCNLESAQSMKDCTKNPGHNNFIPIRELGLQHLPLELQNQDILEFIQCTANLTVRLTVNCVSDNRSAEKGPVSDSGDVVNGTGFITWIEQLPESWKFTILTSKHVVFDTLEAKCTFVDLHNDDDRSHRDGRCKTLRGEMVIRAEDHTDSCIFSCVTHDKELATRMQEQVKQWHGLYGIMVLKDIQTNAVFIVSHPHGRPKLVSVGEKKDGLTAVVGGETIGYLFSYTAGTCPGSSGAIVLSLRDMRESAFQKGVWMCTGNHWKRGNVEGWNDGFGFYPREGTSNCETQGTRQVQRLGNNPTHRECWKAWGECPYKGSHKHFIPIKEFTAERPFIFFSPTFNRFIEAVAGLTVRLRIQNVDGEQASGTGLISDIRRINLNSWELSIITAHHNVYVNGKEPKWKWIDLFYDSEEDRFENRVKTIKMAQKHFCRKDTDWISLNCYTEDAVLAEEVMQLHKRRYESWSLLKYSEATTDYVVIISHPHGLSKQISVGKLEEWKQICEVTVRGRYRANTCFGSSGAPVISPRDPWGGKTWGVWVHHCAACDDDGLKEGYC